MSNRFSEIEYNPRWRRIERDMPVPEFIKEAASSPEITDIVNDPKAKLVEGQNIGYLARVNLVEDVYLVSFVRFGNCIAVGLSPEYDWNTNLPILCASRGIVKHLALQVRENTAWVYR